MQSQRNAGILAQLQGSAHELDGEPHVVRVGFLMFAILRDRIVMASMHDYAETFRAADGPVRREPTLGKEAKSARRLLAQIVESATHYADLASHDRRAAAFLLRIGLIIAQRGVLLPSEEGIEEVQSWLAADR